jgi:hypothetical protein
LRPFKPVLCARLRDRLPLHISRNIRAAGTKQLNVIDYPTGTRAEPLAGRGTRVHPNESGASAFAARDLGFGRQGDAE